MARVELAALRASRQVSPDQEALDSADLLREFLSRRLSAASTAGGISEDVVPSKETRESLQKSLASLSRTKRALDTNDEALLKEVILLLSAGIEGRRWQPEEGKRLHSLLPKLELKVARRSPGSKTSNLRDLLDACR